MENIKRKASCHPELDHYCKGLCRNCYEKELRNKKPDYAERQRENSREWNKSHKRWKQEYDTNYRTLPEYQSRKTLRARYRNLKKFGLSVNDGDALIKFQSNVCAICGGPPGNHWFHLDHDHETGEVRGFLCGKCNKGIGLLGDCEEGIERALKFLKNPPFIQFKKDYLDKNKLNEK